MKIVIYPAQALAEKAIHVEPLEDVSLLIKAMIAAMNSEKGIGLAAPQLGVLKRVIVFHKFDGGGAVSSMINPAVLSSSGVNKAREGCLSLPSIHHSIERALQIEVSFESLDRQNIVSVFSGLEARIILHEIDHLNGVTLIDHMKPMARKSAIDQLRINRNRSNADE